MLINHTSAHRLDKVKSGMSTEANSSSPRMSGLDFLLNLLTPQWKRTLVPWETVQTKLQGNDSDYVQEKLL